MIFLKVEDFIYLEQQYIVYYVAYCLAKRVQRTNLNSNISDQ